MIRKTLAVAGAAALLIGVVTSGAANAEPAPVTNTVRTADKALFIPGNTMNGDFSTATVQPKGVELVTATAGDQAGYLRKLDEGTKLAEVTSFGFRVMVAATSVDTTGSPTLQLGVYKEDGSWDGTLVGDPHVAGSTPVKGEWLDFQATNSTKFLWTHAGPDWQSQPRTLADWKEHLGGYGVGYYGVEQGSFPNVAERSLVNNVHIVTASQDVTDVFTSEPAFQPSVLTAANLCRLSSSGSQNAWQVTNNDARDRTFHAGVTYAGRTTWFGYPHTVKTGGSTAIVSPYGGTLTIQYYDGSGSADYKTATATSNYKTLC